MRRNANREERGGRLLSALAAAVLLTLLLGIIHRLYHCEYTDTDTPNDCFAVSAATGETALPKMVCLTFDDGPSKNTVPILEILDREQVPATFFVCAQDANERYLPLVADIAAAGHQIALHSATHQYSKMPSGRISRRCGRRWSPMLMSAALTGCAFPAAAQTRSATATAGVAL